MRAKYSSRLTPLPDASVIRYTPEEEVAGRAGKNKVEVFALMPKLALARYPWIICFCVRQGSEACTGRDLRHSYENNGKFRLFIAPRCPSR